MKRFHLLTAAIAGCLMIPATSQTQAADQPELKKSVELEANGELKEKKTTDLWLGTPLLGVGFTSPCNTGGCFPNPCHYGNCYSQPYYGGYNYGAPGFGQPIYNQPLYNTPVYQPRHPYGYQHPGFRPQRPWMNNYGHPYGYGGRFGALEGEGVQGRDQVMPVSNMQGRDMRYQPLNNPGAFPQPNGLDNARDNGYVPVNRYDSYPAPLNQRPLDNPYYR